MVKRGRFVSATRSAFNFLLDLLYPPRCGGCGKFGVGWWCAECQARTAWLKEQERIREIDVAPGQSLMVISSAIFEPPLREGIHAFKYEGTPQLASTFAHSMFEAWRVSGLAADLIVPVPLHASRLRERGFNQSELLVKHLNRTTGIPIEPKVLRRIRHTQQQAHLSAAERKANVRDAFIADASLANGKHILLVDDVLTTGATLAECATALRSAGAQNVLALTLARAQP
jgi:ComF family protein